MSQITVKVTGSIDVIRSLNEDFCIAGSFDSKGGCIREGQLQLVSLDGKSLIVRDLESIDFGIYDLSIGLRHSSCQDNEIHIWVSTSRSYIELCRIQLDELSQSQWIFKSEQVAKNAAEQVGFVGTAISSNSK
eukprot:Protomagalhaensia_sp_Gyna_25__2762@NODE_2592_length_994_cov_117_963351_g2154_i0_p1_GENE_NODE_2592_length_994_cov_117_963351_g2154_i0NODE_2592_length_994_cov_117_963351_g2154_i0_p1_ORF_typecomplete_len133_score19_83FBA_1/PF07734_13/0_14_NODE_2592_length_994_cov_117_963351_g2154_i054452